MGYAVAEAAIENGARVTISSSSQQRVDSAVKSLRSAYPSATNLVSGFACDVSKRASLESSLISLLDHAGPIDHVVWTAGNSIPATPISEASLEAVDHAATVRYLAPIFLAKHAPKYLTNSFESSITLTTGVVAEKPLPNWSVIAGGRSAVVGLARNLALDLRPVRVNAVALGAVDTGAWAHLPQEAREEMVRSLVLKTTTGRIADAADVAEAYLYCMKDRNVTGSVISSNGGALLM